MLIARKGRPKKNQPNNYVNNKKFLEMLLEYKVSPTSKMYERIGSIILMIAQRYIMKPKFSGYDQFRKDEMVSDACLYMLTACLKNFNPEISNNPFAYFTTASDHAFLQHINKTKLRESRCSTISYIQNLEERQDDE